MIKTASRSFIAALLLVSAAAGCRQKKEAAGASPAYPIVLDTLQITAPAGSQPVYRASNTLSNDLLHTRLDVRFDWERARLIGKAELRLRPYFYPVDHVHLNARGMEIDSVTVYALAEAAEDITAAGGKRNFVRRKLDDATFTYDGDSLRVRFATTIGRGEEYFVLVKYVAKPEELPAGGGSAAIIDDKGLYFINPRGENPFRMPQVWTQGETQANSVWFPTIDSPNEKMTQELFITVDDKYTTLSNGTLVDSRKNSDGTRTDHWKQDQPHAPYLTMMAVGEFVKVTDTPVNGKEVSYYVEKEHAGMAREVFAETRDMIAFYSRLLGVNYPWDKYAQVVVREYVSGAMENTSATLHGDFMVYQNAREIADERKGTGVIAHELFHQWFGNLVTCESWSNLPLNESFATYGEYLWNEHRYGRDTADEHHWHSRKGYLQAKKEANMIRFDYRDKEDMFDAISYNKGGQVLHMLRKAVGDDAFFAALKKYLDDNRFKPVEIHHLRLAFEEVTGRDLNWFFNQWFFSKGRPQLKVEKTFVPDAGKLLLKVEQVQDTGEFPVYRLPLKVDVHVAGGVEQFSLDITNRTETFTLAVKTLPDLVIFDAERQLLADVDYPRPQNELISQYKMGPRFGDRMEALQLLEPSINDSAVFVLFSVAAQRDRNVTIRKHAIDRLVETSPSYSSTLRGALMSIFKNDRNGKVRAQALVGLNKRFMHDPEVAQLNDAAVHDQSPAVGATAITALSRRDPVAAVKAARTFTSETSRDLVQAITAIFGTYGGDGDIGFFRQAMPYVTGFDMLPFLQSYGRLAQRCEMPSSILLIANDVELIGRGAGKYTRYGVGRTLKALHDHYAQEAASLSRKLGSAKNDPNLEKRLRDVAHIVAELRKISDRAQN